MQQIVTGAWSSIVGAYIDRLNKFETGLRFRRVQSRRQKRRPVPHLSRASACVWQMDREG